MPGCPTLLSQKKIHTTKCPVKKKKILVKVVAPSPFLPPFPAVF
jgi:hypothetical protein